MMNEFDNKVFEFKNLLKSLKLIKFDIELWNAIGIIRQNVQKVKDGKAHFTLNHIKSMCEIYNGNTNWFFNLEENPFRIVKTVKNKPEKSA